MQRIHKIIGGGCDKLSGAAARTGSLKEKDGEKKGI